MFEINSERATAIWEILLMLLVAFIIGFIIAWLLRKNKKEVIDNTAEIDGLKSKLQKATSDYDKLKLSVDASGTEIGDLKSKLLASQQDYDKLKLSLADSENSAELGDLKAKLQQASVDYDALKVDMGKVQADLDECRASKVEAAVPVNVSSADLDNAQKLGFEAASADDKDDLTRISGIGPFIEKKLNGLGIYTFKQISGFTDDTIERVTEAIEFFPGRIQRDNWVSQAHDFYKAKTNS